MLSDNAKVDQNNNKEVITITLIVVIVSVGIKAVHWY